MASAILGQRLEQEGIGTRVLPADAISFDGAGSLNTQGIEAICLVYLSKWSAMNARYACARVRRQAPSAKIMFVLLSDDAAAAAQQDPNTASHADLVATSLSQAVHDIKKLAAAPIEDTMVPPPLPACEPERLAELKQLKILDTEPEETFDNLTRRLAEAFDAPIALLSIIDEYRQFWKSATGLPEDLAMAREAPKETSICGHVVASDQVLVIEDVLKDKRFANNPFLRERGIRFYAGAPLHTSSGHVMGSLCVLDTQPRTISARERTLLQILADEVTSKIEKRVASADTVPRADGTGHDSQGSSAGKGADA